MKISIKRAVLIVFIFLFGFFVFSYFYHGNSGGSTLTLYGNVDVREVDIGFRVSGLVDQLFFQEGQKVKKGQLVAQLAQDPYDSELEKAHADLEAVYVEWQNAKTLVQRRSVLEPVGGVSQENLDDAQAKCRQLEANVMAAKANYRVKEDNLRYTKTYAPSDAVVLTRVKEPGSIVQPGDSVYTLSVVCPVWIRAYVDEPQLGFVKFGMDVEVFTDTKGAKPYKGKVGFISPVAEFTPKTVQTTQLRTDLVYRIKVYIEEPDDLLKQGMPVTLTLKKAL